VISNFPDDANAPVGSKHNMAMATITALNLHFCLIAKNPEIVLRRREGNFRRELSGRCCSKCFVEPVCIFDSINISFRG
jgi:hypothetical protein